MLRALIVATAGCLTMMASVAQAQWQDDLLSPEVAFHVSAERMGPERIRLAYEIAQGYAMYRAKFRVTGLDGFVVDGIVLPAGERINDPYLGPIELYRGRVEIVVSGQAAASNQVNLEVTSQGCADIGVCFNPTTNVIHVSAAPGV
jgi:thiol:disulfide interchange protein DsbD